MNSSIKIIADDRERNSVLFEILSRKTDTELHVERLPLGDYCLDNQLLIERKTLPDLVTSIKDGRLFSQACRLTETEMLSAILLEGTSKDLQHTRMRREAIQGALVTVSLYFGIPILRARHAEESANIILFAAKQGRATAQHALPRHGRRPKGKRAVQSRVLQGLPLVGPQRARHLLEHFGSVEQALTADATELMNIDGIGAGVAETIRWAVRESAAKYAT